MGTTPLSEMKYPEKLEHIQKTLWVCDKLHYKCYSKFYSFRRRYSYQFAHCTLELLVPHAVDEGVQCWRHH